MRLSKRRKKQRGMLPAIFQRAFARSSLPERYAHLEQARYRAAVQKYEGRSWHAFGITVDRGVHLSGAERKIFLFGFEFRKRDRLPYQPLTQNEIVRMRVGEFFGIVPKQPELIPVPLHRELRNVDPGKGVLIRARDARVQANLTTRVRIAVYFENRRQQVREYLSQKFGPKKKLNQVWMLGIYDKKTHQVVDAGIVVREKLLGKSATPVLKPRRPQRKKKFSPVGRGGGGKW